MAINRVSFSAQSIEDNTEITLELLASPPDTTAYLETPVAANRLYGYYNSLGFVELYITDTTGRRYIKVS